MNDGDYTPEQFYSTQRDPYALNAPPGPRESPFPPPASRVRSLICAVQSANLQVLAGANLDLPGPAAGFVRVYDPIQVVSAALAGPLSAALILLLNPGSWKIAQLVASAATISSSFRVPALSFGESIRITNGSPNTANVSVVWQDIPADGIGQVRLSVTTVLQTVIAAPAAGLARRWLQIGQMSGVTRAANVPFVYFNADSVGHSGELLQGGLVIMRNTNVANSGILGANLGTYVTAVTGALQARVTEAMGTGQVNLLGTYETIAAAA